MRITTNILCVIALLMIGAPVLRGQNTTPSGSLREPLKSFLRNYLTLGGKVPPDMTTKISAVQVEAENEKSEEIVYVSGQGWCGSGGCTLLILQPSDSTFKVLGKVTIVQLPIRLLPSMKNGYPDIGVTVQGGGILTGYEAVLSFNGKNYPRNPSLPPARKVSTIIGKAIIPNIEGSVPLYD